MTQTPPVAEQPAAADHGGARPAPAPPEVGSSRPPATSRWTADKALVRPLTSLTALAGLVAAFISLFPSQQRLQALSRQRESDALSMVYMQLLLRTHPEDEALRSAVAHNLAGAGQWEQARGTLIPVAAQSGQFGQRMRIEALEVEFFILQQLPRDSAQKGVVTGHIAAQIEALRREPLAPAALARLAEISLAVGQPLPAAQIYHQLAAVDRGKRPGWLERAATQYLAANAPERAAPVYEEAALDAASDSARHRKYTLLALDAHLAANQGRQALGLVKAAAPRLAGDAQFMRRAVAVARAQNDVPTAQQLGRQLLALAPDDAALVAQQLDLELAVRDIAAALRQALHLVALAPGRAEHRARLASIAEWAGKPAIALEQWSLLARAAPASEAMDNALRLAQALQNDVLWLELAAQVVPRRALKAQESAALAAIQMRQADAGPLIAFLNEYRRHRPLSPAQAEVLAQALAQQGDVAAALAVWQAMSPRQISPVEAARRQAELLVRLHKPDEAWAVLQPARAQATPGEVAYWQAVGDLAWQRESRPEALAAYRQVWDAGSFNVLAMERLIALYNASGQPRQAIAIGTQAYQRLGQARWLLLALDAASQASLWEAQRELSKLAQQDEARFAKSEMYWLLQAQLASHDGARARARTAYQRALALSPDAMATRVQLLWFEIDGGEPARLDGYLQQWQADAQAEPAYWAPYAVALQQLKKPAESLVWFERQASAKPDDDLWALSHAQALEQAGQAEAARRLRARLHPRLKARLATEPNKPGDKGLLLAYAAMVREFEGAAAADQVLARMLASGHDDPQVYEQLVASSLSQENFDQAHGWLARAQAGGHPLPAYQSLAVALAQDDRPALQNLLQQRDQELSLPDRVTALRQLGQTRLALSLTEQSLLDADEASAERLRQHREQLRAQLARRIEAGYQARNLGDLRIARAEVAADVPLDGGRVTVRLARNRLRADGSALQAVDGLHETDASVQADVAVGKDPVRLSLGRNQRADTSLTYGGLTWRHGLGRGLEAQFDVSLHGLTEETSALRAFGRRDKVGLGLSGKPSDTTYGRLALAGQRFDTRAGERLGSGWRLEGEFGGAFFQSAPAWQLRLSGSTEKNRLAERLPAALAASMGLPPASVESVLAPRFSTLGVGATYRFGLPEGTQRAARGLIDGWVGRQWPASELAYSLRAGVSFPVRGAGQIRLEGFYTNVQGGVSTQANRGISLLYRHEF